MKMLRLLFTFVLIAAAQEILTNDSILKMVKGGLGDDLIITIVHNQPGRYSLTPDDLVKLKQRVGLLEAQYASLSARVDRIAGDVVQIKRRLDLVEA